MEPSFLIVAPAIRLHAQNMPKPLVMKPLMSAVFDRQSMSKLKKSTKRRSLCWWQIT
ncbi:hypothetical protein HY11_12230 [Hyphomonas pacifica]|nr:hypothetical protein HY11_12230 [Hyphomonas pacifica]